MASAEPPPHFGNLGRALCYARYSSAMETISHRELRNQSGSVLKAVAAGESYTVTNNGSPVARLVPVDEPTPDLRCTRPASKRGGFKALQRYPITGTISESLDDLRGDR